MNKTPSKLLWEPLSKLLWETVKFGLRIGVVLLILYVLASTKSNPILFSDDYFEYQLLSEDEATGERTASLNRAEGITTEMEEFDIPSTAYFHGKAYRITRIRGVAFSSCSNLTSITIPEGITRIGEGAFQNCKSLKNVYFKGPPAYSFIRAFGRKTVLHYIEGTPGWTTPEWNGFTTRIWVPEP
ncbi:MAG: hypothetical protein EOM61_10805 [Bacteroidia bacterium]|nr:hypothetical protein [Bacteroidia bacterium]